MAELKSSVIGELSGTVANIIFRNRNGKTVAYSRSGNHKSSRSLKAKKAQSNFAVTVKLAKSVNSVPALKEIWTASKLPGVNSFQKLIKNNSRRVSQGSLTVSNIITPPGQFLKLNSASVDNNILYLSFECPECAYVSFPAHLFVYIYFGKEGTIIIPLVTTIEKPEPDGIYNLELALDNRIKRLLSKDPSPLIYLALKGGTSYKNKKYWTTTAPMKL
jgi:hypothetical protein